MNTLNRTADERRRKIAEAAARMGIDEAYISLLVETFYGKVRAHPELGPIFADKISDWRPHLARMKDFWSSVALGSGRYNGRPAPKHVAIDAIEPEHFTMWLGLFEKTLAETAPSPAAARFFMERAQQIAQSIKLAIFGLPGLVSGVREARQS